jgi:phage tail-like protein
MRRVSLVAAVVAAVFVLVLSGPASAGARKDPFLAFTFRVTIDAQGSSSSAGFFKSVSGLSSEVEVVDYREGGDTGPARKLIGATKWKNIVLKRGFVGFNPNDPVQAWAREVLGGKDVRKDLSVVLLDSDGKEVSRVALKRCVVVKWDLGTFLSPRDPASGQDHVEAPAFDAQKSDISIETIEIAHEGIEFGP